jgi:hypothetical protein
VRRHFHDAIFTWNVTHYTPIPRAVAYVVASIIAITSSAHACSGARDIMKPIAKGDWVGALKLADNCVAEDRAASPAPGSVTTDTLLTVANVNFWEQGRAILNAKLRQQKPAEEALQRAVQWAQQYSLDNSLGFPIVPLTDATRGYLAEQRGDQSMAVQNYNSADAAYPDVASSRLALIAFDTGDEKGADVRAETIVKKDPEEPTALYVLGRLADQRNAPRAAVKFFELALKGITEATVGNPSYPLKYMEQDRIIKALAADRSR